MKTDTLVILGAAALGLYVINQMTRKSPAMAGANSLNRGGQVAVPGYATQVFNSALPGSQGFGWQYFTDGTAIGPDGSYYQQGQKVWSPT